jgi:hypothetical protein
MTGHGEMILALHHLVLIDRIMTMWCRATIISHDLSCYSRRGPPKLSDVRQDWLHSEGTCSSTKSEQLGEAAPGNFHPPLAGQRVLTVVPKHRDGDE